MAKFSDLEPVRVRSWIMAAIGLVGALGFKWATDENAALLAGLVGALLALVQGFVTRPAVTPNAKVLAYVEDPNKPQTTEIVAGEATVPPSRTDSVVAASMEAGEG